MWLFGRLDDGQLCEIEWKCVLLLRWGSWQRALLTTGSIKACGGWRDARHFFYKWLIQQGKGSNIQSQKSAIRTIRRFFGFALRSIYLLDKSIRFRKHKDSYTGAAVLNIASRMPHVRKAATAKEGTRAKNLASMSLRQFHSFLSTNYEGLATT